MKRILIIISMVLNNLAVFSQVCTDENVTQIPGKWKLGMRGSSDHSAADMVKERALMNDIIKTIRTNFTWPPTGGDISYGNVYSVRGLDYRPLPVIKICNQYYPYVFYQHYFCSNGKINCEDFVVEVTATINDLPFNFPETFFKSKKDKLGYDIETDPETDKYGFIANIPDEKNGVIDYIKFVPGGTISGDLSNIYRILTKPDLLPYAFMSKKEYYEKCKINHLKSIERYESSNLKLAEAKVNVDKRGIEMNNSMIDNEQNYISKIDQLLSSKSVDELAKPAFSGEENGAYIEASVREFNNYYVIKPNIQYYNNKLPKSSPQVVTICFQYASKTDRDGEKHFADEAFYNELERIKIMDLLTAKLQPLIVQ